MKAPQRSPLPSLDRGAMPRLVSLTLTNNAIGDSALAALAPALRRRPALEYLCLICNPFGDEGLAALVAPPLPTGGLKELTYLELMQTHVTDAGCATLAAALDSGALPALRALDVDGIPSSYEAVDAVQAAIARSQARAAPSQRNPPCSPHVL